MIRTVMFFEMALGVLAFLGVLTQMFIPAIRGTALFPLLRKERQEAIDAFHEAREEDDIQEIRRAAGVYKPEPTPEVVEPKKRPVNRRR